MNLGQKFTYEHGITFQSDQRTYVLITKLRRCLITSVFFCIEIPTDFMK